MNVQDAAYNTVHGYPGGSESLGPRMGMSAAVLRNKVNTNTSTHHLTLAETDLLLGVQGDHSILHALAGNHGYVLQRVDVDASTDDCMLSALLAVGAAKGELAGVLMAALADGSVSANDRRAIACAGAPVQAALVRLMSAAYQSAGNSTKVGSDA